YEDRAPGLGREFFEEVMADIRTAVENPEVGTTQESPFRRMLCRRFPFVVVYRQADDELRILAVAHQRRRPGYWKERD
nr:type II toxin-antitoxin system RelE/ParE family toxin [Gemmatimonadota bacterium]